jgi:hypothetical protein
MGAVILDRLRVAFPYLVAVALPLAGIVIAVVRYAQGDREDALRIALAAFLGMCLYGLLFV